MFSRHLFMNQGRRIQKYHNPFYDVTTAQTPFRAHTPFRSPTFPLTRLEAVYSNWNIYKTPCIQQYLKAVSDDRKWYERRWSFLYRRCRAISALIRMTSEHSEKVIADDGVILENGDIVNKDGKKLYCYYWKPKDGNIKALVHMNHGFAEHMQYYDRLGRLLASRGLLAFGHDHVGHGRSEGDRAFVKSADDYVQDVFQHTEQMKKKHPNLAVHIFGHSMGGMIALSTVLKHPGVYKTMCLMGPLIAFDSSIAPSFLIYLAKFADRFVPQLAVAKLQKELITRDPEMQKKILDDDLFWKNGVKIHWFVTVSETVQYNSKHLGDVDIPFLVLHGTADKLCDINGSKKLIQSSPSTDKEFKENPEAAHHLFCEYPDVRKEALNDTVAWLEQRI